MKGRIEHLCYAIRETAFLYVEVKKTLSVGESYLNMVAQVIAEAEGITMFPI
jgi:hypothetical protein